MENFHTFRYRNEETFPPIILSSCISVKPKVINENDSIPSTEYKNKSTQLCRLCANVVDKATHLFADNEKGYNLAEKINSCLPVTVTKNDVLPKQLCSNCIEKLHECFQFSLACVSAERRLIAQNSHSPKNVCCNYAEINNEETNNGNYSCPHCSEGTLQFIDHVTNYEIGHTTAYNCGRIDNISTCTFSEKNYSLYQKDIRVNIANQVIKQKENFHAESCVTTDHENQGTLQELNSHNFICRLCNTLFDTTEMIYNHCKSHSKCNSFPCVLCCDAYFISELQLEAHFYHFHHMSNCSVNLKEIQHEINFHDKFRITKSEIFYKSLLSHISFPTQQSEELSTVKFNIYEEILQEEKKQYNDCLVPESNNNCEICGLQFNTDALLLIHMNTEHMSKNKFKNGDYDKYFGSPVILKQQECSDQVERSFQCEICGETFNQLFQIQKHKKHNHFEHFQQRGQICYMCSECKAVFPDMTEISDHNLIHDQCNISSVYVNDVFKCEYCDLCFLGREDLKKHLSQHVGELPYTCLYCNLQFESYYKVMEHKKSHEINHTSYNANLFSVPIFYICEFCEKNFEQWQYLYIHRHKSHLHGRTLCSEETTKKKILRSVRSADSNQSHLCEICGKTFESQSMLTKHRKQEHPQTSKYQCPDCGKVLANLTGLIIHRRLHTGEKPFVCDVCGKSFHQSSGMYTHRRTHTRECPYRCEYCGQAYNVKGDLDNHRRAKHTKERPFKCETCQKSFLTSSVFYQHRILHTGVRKYKCVYCEKSFARWNALRLHIRTHTGEKPYICYVCQRGFAQKGDMKKHMKTQHNIHEVPENT